MSKHGKKTFKEWLFKNGWSIFAMVGGIIVFIFSFILNLRSDINTTQFQVRALQQDHSAIQAMEIKITTLEQTSNDIKDDVSDMKKEIHGLYQYFINN